MRRKIKKYIDNLFEDIYETHQLRELKEEIASNLLEKYAYSFCNRFYFPGFN